MNFKWSFKKITILITITLISLNSIFLFSYYKFYLSNKLVDNIVEAKDYNHRKLYYLTRLIDGRNLDETVEILDSYAKKNNGYITLSTLDGEIIYQKKSTGKLFSSATFVYIDGNNYELTYSSSSISSGLSFMKKFVFYEIIIISIILLIIFTINSTKIINPMEIILKDINDYKFGKIPYKRKLPKNMQQIQNTFVDMTMSLEEEKENQNRIIASISHDIKTPLTSVIGYADLLKNKNLSDEKKKSYIDKIYNKALMMKDILEEFDDYQSCNIKDTLKLEEKKIDDILEDINNNYYDDLKEKKINLIINNDAKNKSIKIDYIKIKRIFSNVITNSVKNFNGKPGTIKINVTYDKEMVRFEVADNGGGVDEKNLKKIFKPLYTTDPSRKISGLGLSICKQIISAHDGNIHAKNNSENGLSIIFYIPC